MRRLPLLSLLTLAVAVAAIVIALLSGSRTVTRAPLGPPTAHTQAVPGHPCDPGDYVMQCAYNAAGQQLTFLPRAQFGFSTQFGIDFAWGGPPPAVAVRGGVSFAVSYLSGSSKDWPGGLLHAYINRGLAVGFVWETAAAEATSGCYAGARDARRANELLGRYGIPTSGPKAPAIFLAVDTDTSAASVAPYFQCAHQVLGHRTGAYGGYPVIAGLFNRGIIGYGWQTIAWSYGRWDLRAKLEQTSIERSFYGYSVDHNRRIAVDAGLYPVPNPGPPPVRCFGHRAQVHAKRCQAPRARVGARNAEIRRIQRQLIRRGCRKVIDTGPASFPQIRIVRGQNYRRGFCQRLFRIGRADHAYVNRALARTY